MERDAMFLNIARIFIWVPLEFHNPILPSFSVERETRTGNGDRKLGPNNGDREPGMDEDVSIMSLFPPHDDPAQHDLETAGNQGFKIVIDL